MDAVLYQVDDKLQDLEKPMPVSGKIDIKEKTVRAFLEILNLLEVIGKSSKDIGM